MDESSQLEITMAASRTASGTSWRSERGSVTAEWAVGVVAAISAALMLCVIILSAWFEEHLYRPFVFGLSLFF